jgi:hypothetical protein
MASLIVFLLITIILGVVGIGFHVAYYKVANVMLGFKFFSFSVSFGNVYLGLGSINIFSIWSFIDHVNC